MASVSVGVSGQQHNANLGRIRNIGIIAHVDAVGKSHNLGRKTLIQGSGQNNHHRGHAL